jgi:hypothetical protein
VSAVRLPQINFFATREDLAPGLGRLDERRPLQYVTYLDPGPQPPVHASLLAIPDLGRARTGDHMSGHCYLVMERGAEVPVRGVPQKGGAVQHMVDLDRLPPAAIFRPGGVFEERVLISGNLGPVGDGEESLALYRDCAAQLFKGFQKIKAYKVGPEAARALDEGWRLVTISVRSPAGYDLRR